MDRHEKVSLEQVVGEQLSSAADDSAGRASRTLVGGSEATLRQTVIALTRGRELSEHENPGSATVQVLRGSVEIVCDGATIAGQQGDLIVVPHDRHSLRALEDSVVLLSAVPRGSARANAGV